MPGPMDSLAAMTKEITALQATMRRYEAEVRLFQAACLENDNEAMEHHRGLLHAILDQQLDSIAIINTLQRRMTN